MTDAQAMWASVLAQKTSEAAHGVYADWLEDQGKPEAAAWFRAGCRLEEDEFRASVVAQDDDNDYEESGYVACVVERGGVRVALLGSYSHCSCYGTYTSLVGGGYSDGGDRGRPWFFWVGSVTELVGMARAVSGRGLDGEPIADGYDDDHLQAVWLQIREWADRSAVAEPAR